MDSITPAAAPDAVAHIRADLAVLRRRRIFTLIAFTLVVGLALAALAIGATPGPGDLSRDPRWGASMALFFTAATLTASTAVGFPLWTRVGAFGVTLGSAIALVVALALVAAPGAIAQPVLAHGVPCLSVGTAVAVAALISTALISGRLWRRMQDLSWALAVGASAIGLAFLNAKCPLHDPVHLFGFHLPALVGTFAVARALLGLRRR